MHKSSFHIFTTIDFQSLVSDTSRRALLAPKKSGSDQRMAMDRPLILPACSVRPFLLLLSDPCGLVTPIRRYALAVAGCAPERDTRVPFDAWWAEA